MKQGLVGYPVNHSYSSKIHEFMEDLEYSLMEVSPENLEGFFTKADFSWVNVTIPYKERVIEFLDEVEDKAKAIGAVNLVVNKNGRLYGYNTDYYGMKKAIENMGAFLEGEKVLILGTGGTAKTAKMVVSDLGAKEVYLVSREKTDEANNIISYNTAKTIHSDAKMLINATPVGMTPDVNSIPIDLLPFKQMLWVFDCVYTPQRTRLYLKATELGMFGTTGLNMLVYQAVKAREIVTETENIIDEYSLCKKVKKYFTNIVLVGMPSCGKTTLGKMISEKTGRKFIDLDEFIELKTEDKIPDIIKMYGEKGFRVAEKNAVNDLVNETGAVIACGGGTVLSPQNTNNLRLNGTIYYLERSLDDLEATANRPLSNTYEKLYKLLIERAPAYESAADMWLDPEESLEDIAKDIAEEYL